MIELQLNPLRHFRHGGIDRARRPGVVQILEGDYLQLAVDLLVRKRVVVTGFENGIGCIAGSHPQRLENLFAHVVIPTLSADRCNHLACGQKHQVVVSKRGAEAGGRLQVAEAIDDLLSRKRGVRPEHQVAFTQAQAAAMAKQVADLHLLGNVWRVHHKPRQMVVHRVVPVDFASVYKRCQRRGCERLGIRADAEERVLIHWCGFAEFANSVALGDHYLFVFHNCQRHSWYVECFHRACRVVVQIGWQLVLRSHRRGRYDEEHQDKYARKTETQSH
jgi:hypothetical protein